MKRELEAVKKEIDKLVESEDAESQVSDQELHEVAGGTVARPLQPTRPVFN